MPYRKSFVIAARALRRNRLQTALTTLGMMMGVGTVLVMIAVGSGAERSIAQQVRAAGMNIIVVSSGNYKMPQQWTSQGEAEEPAAYAPQPSTRARLLDGIYTPARRPALHTIQSRPEDNPFQQFARGAENFGGLGAATTLSLADAESIRKLKGIEAVSGGLHDNVSVVAGKETTSTQLRGEEASLPAIRRAWVFKHGRFFSTVEDEEAAPVAVLGSVVSERLFGTASPVGETVTLRGQSFKVIGEIASGSWMVPSAAGDGQFDAVYLPVRTAQKLLGRSALDTITLATESTGDVTRVSKLLAADLRTWHHLVGTTPDDFTVASQAHSAIAHGGMRTDISRAMMGNAGNLDKMTLDQLGKTLEHASHTMSALLAATAAVSLLVGGIGIMNIMLLSVTERTREIGVRRAVGARSSELMQQFLLEAVLLSVGGGLLGIALGLAAATFVTRLAHWSTELSWIAVAVAFGVSAAVGIVFGFYPARQASRVSPMVSLRYE